MIDVFGNIVFDPPNYTRKHQHQGSWKKIAIISIEGELTEYYAWFIKKKFRLKLNRPLRGAHITFINDRETDMNGMWEEIKSKWNGIKLAVPLAYEFKTDGKYWWFNVPKEYNGYLHLIRNELGLDRPYWGLHMTIGYANEKFENHSQYIYTLLTR